MNPLKTVKLLVAWGRLQRLWRTYQMTREPVMLMEIVKAGAVILALFGFNLTAEQIGAIAIVAGMILGLIARAKVTPVKG